MTETEKKALALVNEACKSDFKDLGITYRNNILDALLLAIEQHEAFRQEVSDAVEGYTSMVGLDPKRYFARFIIPKPDPLVEALDDLKDGRAGQTTESYAACLRAAIEARGGRIVWEGE